MGQILYEGEDRQASPNMFRAMVLGDDLDFQIGEDQPDLESAVALCGKFKPLHYVQVFDDMGHGLLH